MLRSYSSAGTHDTAILEIMDSSEVAADPQVVIDLLSRQPFGGHPGPVLAVAVTPDGTEIVSAGSDGSLRIWNRSGGEERATLLGHSGPVWEVAVTPDGTEVVSGGSDGSLRIWSRAGGEQRATQGRITLSTASFMRGVRPHASGTRPPSTPGPSLPDQEPHPQLLTIARRKYS
jgi:WD40 repeat protein